MKQAADNLLIKCIKALPTQDVQKNWSRLENFFKMIYDIATAGKLQVDLLMTKFDIVVEIIDFILGSKSPLAVQRGEKRT